MRREPQILMALYLGLISGTSMDGIDAALAEIDAGSCAVRHASIDRSEPCAATFKSHQRPGDCNLDELGRLDTEIGEGLLSVAIDVLRDAGVAASMVSAPAAMERRSQQPQRASILWQIGTSHLIASAPA